MNLNQKHAADVKKQVSYFRCIINFSSLDFMMGWGRRGAVVCVCVYEWYDTVCVCVCVCVCVYLYIYNLMFSHENKGNPVIWYNLDGP